MRNRFMLLGLVMAGLLMAPAAARAETQLRMATLAPKGSAWANLFEKASQMIEKDTAGRVKIKWYFGAQQGDEADVTRKMRLGQLEGGAVTAVGLGAIKGDVRIFQLPLMWDSEKQLDYVRDKMAPAMEAGFLKEGYVLLAWGDVGWTHMYSQTPIDSIAALKKLKMWAWDVDPIVAALFAEIGINGVPLGVPEVKTALGTGLINACYGAPLSTVALQWYTSVKFATKKPIAYGIGALVVTKKSWDSISAEDQAIIRKHTSILGKKLLTTVRKDNERAKKALEASGVKFVDLPADMQAQLDKAAQSVWKKLVGKVYSQALLDELLAHKKAAPK